MSNVVECVPCGLKFSCRRYYLRHKRNMHPEPNSVDFTGQDQSCGSYEEFQTILNEHEKKTGMHYVHSYCDKAFNLPIDRTKKRFIRWFDGGPCILIGHRLYACDQGPDRNKYQKARYVQKKLQKKSAGIEVKERVLPIPTKKIGCPVQIRVSRVIFICLEKVLTASNDADEVKTSLSKIKGGKAAAGTSKESEKVKSGKIPPGKSKASFKIKDGKAASGKSKFSVKVLRGKSNLRKSKIISYEEQDEDTQDTVTYESKPSSDKVQSEKATSDTIKAEMSAAVELQLEQSAETQSKKADSGESKVSSNIVISQLSVKKRKVLNDSVIQYFQTAPESELQEKFLYHLPEASDHKEHIIKNLNPKPKKGTGTKKGLTNRKRKREGKSVIPVNQVEPAVNIENSASGSCALSLPQKSPKRPHMATNMVPNLVDDSSRTMHIQNCDALLRSIKARMWQLPDEDIIALEEKLRLLDQQLETPGAIRVSAITNYNQPQDYRRNIYGIPNIPPPQDNIYRRAHTQPQDTLYVLQNFQGNVNQELGWLMMQ